VGLVAQQALDQSLARRPSRRVPALLIVLLLVIGLPVVVGGGGAAVYFLGRDDTTGGPSGGPSGGPAGSAAGQQGYTTGGPGRYDLGKLPEDECAKVDYAAFTELYDAENGKPTSNRAPNTTINSSTCTISRGHTSSTPTDVRTGTLMIMASAYNDVALAVLGQKQDVDNAKLAGPNSPVPGLGEEAIVYETPGTAEHDKTQLALTLTVRDSNVRMTIYLTAYRNDNAGYSQRDKNDLRDRLITIAKVSFPKTIAGMQR
jgi:hypothetical protein